MNEGCQKLGRMMIKYSNVRSTKNQYVAGCFAVMAGMLLFACPVQAAESGINQAIDALIRLGEYDELYLSFYTRNPNDTSFSGAKL